MPGALLDPSAADATPTLLTAPPPPHPFDPSSWVPTFRRFTARTRLITLQADYLTTLLSGAAYTDVAVPLEAGTQTESISWSDGSVDVVRLPPERGELSATGPEAAIEAAIIELGGAVCPKFGRACPVDATWANFHRSTKCTSADDVLTLLKSSERVMETVLPGRDVELALRKWADLDDRMEFRCFVRDDVLVGVCPRLVESSIEYAEDEMDTLVGELATWFERRVADVFAGPRRYVLDVYKDRRGKVWVIDFGPWGDPTEGLLFEWDELEHSSWMALQNRAQFRCAYRNAAIRPSRRMFDGLPLELRNPQAMASLAEAAQRLTVGQLGSSDENESESE